MGQPQERFTKYEKHGAYHWAECERWSKSYEPATEARYAVVARRVKGGRLLDIGCGDGYLAGLVAESCERVIGIDNEASAIAIAERLLADQRNSEFMLATCDDLPFEDGAFDTVVLTDVIEHLQAPSGCLREVARVLRPEGRALLTTPQWRPDRMWDPEQHWKEYKPHELADLLGEHFRSVDMSFFVSTAWWQIRRRLGKGLTRNFARFFYNPFAREGTDPTRFWHMLAICAGPGA